MIGKLYVSVFRYYDRAQKRESLKRRPVLIIGSADTSDYVVLPISKVTSKEHLHSFYDYNVGPKSHPNSNLNSESYIRTHKQTVMRKEELVMEISDFKALYPDDYREIIKRVGIFQESITAQIY